MPFIFVSPSEDDFSSQLDGATTAFALSAHAVAGTLTIYLNGLRQAADGEDYTIVDSNHFTMVDAPEAGEVLRAVYIDQELVRYSIQTDREPSPPRYIRVGRRVIRMYD